MQVRLLLGPAGSGKTFRCLTEVRRALAVSPDGPPLLLLSPKQSTYQLERQFLADLSVPGFTRLHIFSFERLAHFILERLQKASPKLLGEEGRLMVLRSLLAQKRDDLKLFRASARLTGFAGQLSLVLHELQRNRLTPDSLNQLAAQVPDVEGLAYKLQDLAVLLKDYLNWLKAHQLQDANCLLESVTLALKESAATSSLFPIGGLWADGFAEWSPQELDLLAALIPRCQKATLTFCLDRAPTEGISWLSHWSMVHRSFLECKKRLEDLADIALSIETLPRLPDRNRFSNNLYLQHLEKFWAEPRPYPSRPAVTNTGAQTSMPGAQTKTLADALRVATCANPEAEATLAAREVLRHVRSGGRYRDIAVLARTAERYHWPLQRIFKAYEIPFFLDRRELVSHHPLPELTRSTLRTVAFQWLHDDWFAALKTGLVPVEEEEIDRLENETLARGWKGSIWQRPISVEQEPALTRWLAALHSRLFPPFQKFALAMAASRNQPTGSCLAAALREFWAMLKVEERLRELEIMESHGSDLRTSSAVQATVWEQMNAWLANVELAFPNEPLPLREWIPVLEAGLAGLTVGVIPPALDQVLIGALDRSRNPDIKLAIVLGLNETVFPAPPQATALLSEPDRLELEKRNVILGGTAQHQLGRERYYAYIAFTRARERLVLTRAACDSNGAPLNPSPILSQLNRLFPLMLAEPIRPEIDWRESEHTNELVVPLLRNRHSKAGITDWKELAEVPSLASIIEDLRHFQNPELEESLAPELAARLYGPTLRTSVSRVENFAACPFKFFVHSGLRAEERKTFELDAREQGTFQHDVLALFHQQLRRENKRWRDITPREARERVARISSGLIASYRDGMLQASQESRFMANFLTESLQDFVEILVEWMRGQYEFDPVQVELAFGGDKGSPAWVVDLDQGHRLELHGRIDRVDLFRKAESNDALCIVVDYKSSRKQLDPLLLAHGLQLQLLAYLNVLQHWPNPRELFGAARLVPAGVFYVNLRGKYEREPTRREALSHTEQARKLAYRHTGRFDVRALPQLDSRPNVSQGDQFNYRLTSVGKVHGNCREALSSGEFRALIKSVEVNLQGMGQRIFEGQAMVAPYRKGATTACDQCGYRAICRIDPWIHAYRVLKKAAPEKEAPPCHNPQTDTK